MMLALVARIHDPVGIALAVALYLAWLGNVTRGFARGWQSIGWPTATGMLEWVDANPDPSRMRLHVIYRYRVGDRDFKSTQYRITSFSFLSGWLGTSYPLGKAPETWRVGMDLSVHYDPRRPHIATIETGPTVAAAFVVFGHLVAVVGLGVSILVKLLFRL